jgi:hypothetical protein
MLSLIKFIKNVLLHNYDDDISMNQIKTIMHTEIIIIIIIQY